MEKLNGLIKEANNDDNSHLINVEPSIALLSDILSNSSIIGRGMMAERRVYL